MMYIPILIKNIVDNIATISDSVTTVLPLMAVALFGSIVTFIETLLVTFLVEKIILELRQNVVEHSLQQSMSYYNKEPIGRMVTRITKDLDEANNFYKTLLSQILKSVISLITVSIILYLLAPNLLLYALLGLPFIVIFAEFYRKKVLASSIATRKQTGVLNTYLAEHLQGIKDLQLNNKVEYSMEHFTLHNQDLYTKERTLGTYQMFLRPFLNLTLMIMIVSITIGGAFLANKSIVTIGTLFAFIQLIQNFFNPLLSLAQVVSQIQTSLVSLERIFSFLQISTALHSPQETQEILSQIASKPLILTFNNVSFSYNTTTKVLHNINLSLPPGKKVALVGHSGSGKSTITRLCMRFWDPTEGNIMLNNINFKDIPIRNLREKIVLLEQDSFIFHDTVRENISIGRNIAQKKLDLIAEKTGLTKLLHSYKLGWEHILDQKSISTGEQRLIAITRVLVNPPNIILLDEFSASLDNKTETTIQKLLEELQTNRASLVIAHRLNTIKHCDEILYINQGIISEQGTHKELLAQNGGYANLIKNMEETRQFTTR